jgi:hypothetical protein
MHNHILFWNFDILRTVVIIHLTNENNDLPKVINLDNIENWSILYEHGFFFCSMRKRKKKGKKEEKRLSR